MLTNIFLYLLKVYLSPLKKFNSMFNLYIYILIYGIILLINLYLNLKFINRHFLYIFCF